jgi:hypothetical protein
VALSETDKLYKYKCVIKFPYDEIILIIIIIFYSIQFFIIIIIIIIIKMSNKRVNNRRKMLFLLQVATLLPALIRTAQIPEIASSK